MSARKDFYRVKEICSALNISRVTLWRKIEAGIYPALEIKNPRVVGYTPEKLQEAERVKQS